MRMYHPDPGASMPISRQLGLRLGSAALDANKMEWEIIEQAFDEWMRKHLPGSYGEPQFAGYQWKSLFLPADTVLRTVFNGKQHHCRVVGDKVIHDDKAVSPSGFVAAVGGIRRNAWKSIWVLLPDATCWQRADAMRLRRRPAPARRIGHGARAANAPLESASTQGIAVPVDPPAVAAPAPEPCTVPQALPPSAAPPALRATPPDGATASSAAPQPAHTGQRSAPARQAHAHPAIAGWACKPRAQRRLTSSVHRVAALLGQEFVQWCRLGLATA